MKRIETVELRWEGMHYRVRVDRLTILKGMQRKGRRPDYLNIIKQSDKEITPQDTEWLSDLMHVFSNRGTGFIDAGKIMTEYEKIMSLER